MTKDTEKRKDVASFTEKDTAALVEKYDASTVLTLLQEMANYPHSKFDWNKLIEQTSTGISNAREYQMLWRHLAYGHALEENLDDNAQPLDDDSDIEREREAPSPITKETASEAAACVKAMTASHKLSEAASTSSLIKAPLTISVPVCGPSTTSDQGSQPSNLMQEKSIIFLVTVPRKAIPNRRTKRSDSSGNTGTGKKGKMWSEEEDMQLRAAVQRWGEGNWAHMARKDEFPLDRTAPQLAKRWSTLRKNGASTKSGNISASSQHNAE